MRDVVLRRRALRWLAPAGVLTVAGLAVSGVFAAGASESKNLPTTTPGALLAAVRAAPTPEGFYGTILSQVSLGLPQLPDLGGAPGSASAGVTTFASLLSGSHTLQVWYGGRSRQRVALLGQTDETDVFRSGRTLWTWSSAERTAQHATLPATSTSTSGPAGAAPSAAQPSEPVASVSPSELAQQALAALAPSTRVTVHDGQQVADRDAYELVLTPRTSATLIGSIHIAVDGKTKLPLGVKVFARGASTPAVDVAYTAIRFATPASSSFQFSPPPGAKVSTLHVGTGLLRTMTGAPAPTVTGSGWTRVVKLDTGHAAQPDHPLSGQLRQVLTPVSGSWGHGGLLQTALSSVLVTSKGVVLAGSVPPSTLFAAAGAR